MDDEPWSLTRLGTLAWVKVDSFGKLAGEDGTAEDGVTYWWPAKVFPVLYRVIGPLIIDSF